MLSRIGTARLCFLHDGLDELPGREQVSHGIPDEHFNGFFATVLPPQKYVRLLGPPTSDISFCALLAAHCS